MWTNDEKIVERIFFPNSTIPPHIDYSVGEIHDFSVWWSAYIIFRIRRVRLEFAMAASKYIRNFSIFRFGMEGWNVKKKRNFFFELILRIWRVFSNSWWLDWKFIQNFFFHFSGQKMDGWKEKKKKFFLPYAGKSGTGIFLDIGRIIEHWNDTSSEVGAGVHSPARVAGLSGTAQGTQRKEINNTVALKNRKC